MTLDDGHDPQPSPDADGPVDVDAAVDATSDEALLAGLLALARGEFDHRIARSGLRDTRDTIAFLFNAMADQIQDLVDSLHSERGRLQVGVEKLSDVLSRMAAADFDARAERSYDGSPLDVLGFLVNATAEELGGLYQELRDTNARMERQAHATVHERLAATNTLAAGVGHELRNPLGVAAGNLEFLAEQLRERLGAGFDADLQRALEDSRVAVDRAATIATELALLRPSPEPSARLMPLSTVVATAIRMVRNVVGHTAELEVRADPAALARVDEARLGQVVMNLVHNAALAMPRERAVGENRIVIDSRVLSADEVAIEVTDNGTGMPAAVQSRVFEAFFTTRPVGEGTGLGLAICQRLVHEQGGRIALTSEVGVGTTFRVVLPRATVATPLVGRGGGGGGAAEAASVGLDELEARLAGLRVLFIDDEVLFHIIVERMLGPSVRFTATVSGVEGLELARAGDFDVVLSDLMLPDLDGREIYEALAAESHPLTTRFAFITGGAFSPEAQEFLDAVDAPVLGKPFSRLEVLSALATVVGGVG